MIMEEFNMRFILLILSVAVSQAMLEQEANRESEEARVVAMLLTEMNERLDHQQRTIQLQQQQISNMQAYMTISKDREDRLEEELSKQTTEVMDLKALMIQQGELAAYAENRLAVNEVTDSDCEVRSEFHAYGCILDVITLTCPNSHINVTDAIYGQYAEACSSCCVPAEDDCSERVADNDLSNWLILKYGCDNESTCGYNYTGQVINQCGVGYVADYMIIYYDCLGGQEWTDPVGFTAYATESRDYPTNAIMLFDGITTNLGGYFDASKGTFRCPFNGVYLFSISVLSQPGGQTYGAIWVDDEYLVDSLADADEGDPEGFSQASSMAVAECGVNQEVSVRATYNSQLYGNLSERHSSFSGYLLQRFA